MATTSGWLAHGTGHMCGATDPMLATAGSSAENRLILMQPQCSKHHPDTAIVLLGTDLSRQAADH